MQPPILKRRPGKTTDHGAPLTREKQPPAKMEPRIEAKVRDMLRDGMPVATIATVLCIGKTGIRRVREQMFPRSTGTAIQSSKKPDYRRILAEARAEAARQLAERRELLKQQGASNGKRSSHRNQRRAIREHA